MKPASTPSPVPLHGDACEAFAQNASLRADRELGRAEQAALDAHLATCPSCRERAFEAEWVSRMLKHWDAERASTVRAPARLSPSIRSMVHEEGLRRRREFRSLRIHRWAMAASVFLVLGAAVFFGLQRVSVQGPSDLTLADVGAPRPTLAFLDVPAPLPPRPLDAIDAGPGPLESLGQAEVRTVAWIAVDEFGPIAEAFRYLALEAAERDFFARTGEQGIRWQMPDGRAGFVSSGALASLRARGVDSVESFLAGLAERTGAVVEPGHVYGSEPTAVLSRRGLPDVFPLSADRSSVDAWLDRADLALGGGRLRMHAIAGDDLATAPAGARRVFDLDRAFHQRHHRLTLAEGGGDDLVLIVQGTRHPIFIPAGELLQGGRVDRVVRRNVWIPPTLGEGRFEIPCVAVSTEAGSTPGVARPTGLVAGPRLRRLLADDATSEQVSVFVDGLTRSRALDFSLLSRFPLTEVRALKQGLAAAMLKRGWRGFGMTDAQGRLAGIEFTGLPLEAGADLLARVALGYELEDALLRGLPAEAQAASGTVVPARVTLMELLAFEGRLRVLAGERGTLRRASLRDARSDVVVEVFEQASSGDVVFASALTNSP